MRIALSAAALAALTLAWPAADAQANTPRASSEARDQHEPRVRHVAANAFDGLLQTGWAEGVDGHGVGSWLELRLTRPTDVSSVSIWPGNLSEGERSLVEYSRPRQVTVRLTGPGLDLEEQVDLPDVAREGPGRIDVPIEGRATAVRVTIDDVWPGRLYEDTFIAQVALNFVEGWQPEAVENLRGWSDHPRSPEARADNEEAVAALYEQVEAGGEEGAEAFGVLLDRVIDGPPWLRDRVRHVPAGFRIQALPPDDVAVDALLQLRDSRAIPALELGVIRSQDDRQLASRLELFLAYDELRRGGRMRIADWGESGWEAGALRGFGEPLAAAMDGQGRLLVADVGNHRVQRFTGVGSPDGSFGAEPGVSNTWFGRSRPWHVTGAAPGTEPGQFTHPVSVTVLPSRDGDGFAVLDASGRVQVYDHRGERVRGWSLPQVRPLETAVGGQGHIERVRNQLVVIWRDEGFVFRLDGEKVAQFELEDGAPSGSVALRNGQVGLIFQDDLVAYSLDGFRHGRLVGDERGFGYEAWDVAADERGRLWVVTDNGWLFKYRRPGRLELQVRFTEDTLPVPRLAVREGIAYVLTGDRVLRVDAQALLEAAAEGE